MGLLTVGVKKEKIVQLFPVYTDTVQASSGLSGIMHNASRHQERIEKEGL